MSDMDVDLLGVGLRTSGISSNVNAVLFSLSRALVAVGHHLTLPNAL